MRKGVIVAIVALLLAAGFLWWRSGGPGGVSGSGADVVIQADDPLRFVPEDSPYVFANLAPLPEPMARFWLNQIDPQIPHWRRQIAMVLDAWETAEAEADSDIDHVDIDPEADPESDSLARAARSLPPQLAGWLRALDAELAQAPTAIELSERFGLGPSSLSAIYGIGLVPVVRLTLDDPAAWSATMARMQANAGQTLEPLVMDGVDAGWRFPLPEVPLQVLMAVIGNHLVTTLAPLDDISAARQLLGLDRPSRSMADSNALQALNRAEDFTAYGSGYIDTARLLAHMRAPASPLEIAFLTPFDIEKPALPAECNADLDLIADSFPRLIAGYTRMDTTDIRSLTRIETAPAIAQDLMSLGAPIPGLAASADALLTLGFSLRAAALPALGNKYATATAQTPWTCPALVWLNDAAVEARSGLNNPALYAAGPMASSLLLSLEEFSFDLTAQKLTSIAGQLVIGSDNPAGLIAMARNFVPDSVQLDLQPGAAPQRLALPYLDSVTPEPVFAAMDGNALGFAIGADQESRLAAHLKSDPDRKPMLHIGYRGSFMTEIAKLMREAAQMMPDETGEEMLMQAQLLEDSYGRYIERMDMTVEATSKGLEFRQQVQMRH
ncbi:hypothetical protein [Denitratimonas sp. CY0512]|uniref:hypothetical protein n=1 Tax=Denitratimonas sp. CY0512 TaxID=3131940 RepID=UPI0030ABC767